MMGMRQMKLKSSGKFAAIFLAGAVIAGGVGAVASTQNSSSIAACADKRTGALFLSSTGTCPTNRTLIQIGGPAMNAKAIAALVTPTVVSISVTAAAGSGTGSGSIYKSAANGISAKNSCPKYLSQAALGSAPRL
jgi:putative serine protease PepD